MTEKALNADELLCDNNTVKTPEKPEENQVFLKNLTDWHDEYPQCCCHTITRSRLKLFIFIGDVYLALFAMRSLKTLLEENKIVFSLNIFYFSVCLTFNK